MVDQARRGRRRMTLSTVEGVYTAWTILFSFSFFVTNWILVGIGISGYWKILSGKVVYCCRAKVIYFAAEIGVYLIAR